MKKSRTLSFSAALFLWLIGIVCLTAADQFTKYLVFHKLKNNASIPLIPGVLELHYLENRGMAFGMLQGRQILFLVLCVIFCITLVWLFIRIPKTIYYLPLIITGGIIASGAAGNFIDRAFRGYVIDFIYFSLIDFPIFNLADIFVVCGGIILVLLVLFRYRDEDFDFINNRG